MHGVCRGFGLVVTVMMLAGCGGAADDGPPRFPVEGTVKVDGTAVANGQISFLPADGGGMTSFQIADGKFSSASKGAVGGPQKVTITLFDGPAGDGDDDAEVEETGVATTTATISDGSEPIDIVLKSSAFQVDTGDAGPEDGEEDDEEDDEE